MARRRQAKHAEHENLERWLLTYADMITLLMAFFIMLYGMSQIDIAKFRAMLGGVRAELGGTGVLSGGAGINSGGSAPMSKPGRGAAPRPGPGPAATTQLRQLMDKSLSELPQSEGVQVLIEGDTVLVRIPANNVYFAPGSAELRPRMWPVLQRIGEAANQQHCLLRVAGHTCDLPVNTEFYLSNWELSADRARNVALYLVRHEGVAPERLSCMGYADTRPLVPNRGEAQRRHNRRVELILTPQTGAPDIGTTPDDRTSALPPRPDIRPAPVDILTGSHKIKLTDSTGSSTSQQVH